MKEQPAPLIDRAHRGEQRVCTCTQTKNYQTCTCTVSHDARVHVQDAVRSCLNHENFEITRKVRHPTVHAVCEATSGFFMVLLMSSEM